MKLDRNINADGTGKYALIKLREAHIPRTPVGPIMEIPTRAIDFGDTPDDGVLAKTRDGGYVLVNTLQELEERFADRLKHKVEYSDVKWMLRDGTTIVVKLPNGDIFKIANQTFSTAA